MARFVLVLLTLVVGIAPGWGQTSTATVTGADKLVVRRGPGKQFPPFASLTEGSKVEVEQVEGEWARIVTGSGQRGYVHSNFLSISGPAEPAAAPATAPPAEPTAERVASEPTATRAPDRARTAETEARASNERKKNETDLRAANERVKALEGELKAATDRVKILEGEGTTLRDRVKSLETDLQSTQQELTQLRTRPTVADVHSTTPPGAELRSDIERLTVAVETLQNRLNSVTSPIGATASAEGGPASDAVSATTVLLGLVGVIVGWGLSGAFGRKQDRSRRSRIRF